MAVVQITSGISVFSGEGRSIVRTATGVLYTCVCDGVHLLMYKSSDNGATWTEQDAAHHPVTDGTFSLAIDATGVIHIANYATATTVKYQPYATATNLWGTITAIASANDFGVAIAVDSANKQHICYGDNDGKHKIFYTNNVGGTFSVGIVVDGGTAKGYDAQQPVMTVDNNNKPQVAYSLAADLGAAIGNANNAASFTLSGGLVGANYTSNGGTSIAIDSFGNTWITHAKLTNGGANVTPYSITHNSANSWATWQIDTVIDASTTVSSGGISLAIDRNTVYVFSDDGNGNILYYVNKNGSWSRSGVLEAAVIYSVPLCKWSEYANNFGSTQIDVVFTDGTNLFWDNLPINQLSFQRRNNTRPRPFSPGVAR